MSTIEEIKTAPKATSLPIKTSFLQSIISEIYATTPLQEFKTYFAESVRLPNDNLKATSMLVAKTQQCFREVISRINDLIYHSGRFTEDQKEEIGQWVHHEFLAFSLLGTWPSRSFLKPQNIAGDHHTIKQIYDGGNMERRPVGQVVNACFFKEPACKAVVNRKIYMRNRILDKVRSTNEKVVVGSIASGPAEEIFEVFDMLSHKDSKRFFVSAIDIDKRACASVDDKIYDRKLQNQLVTHAVDILKVRNASIFHATKDLVYSMGLIDYFSDRLTIKIINIMFKMLKPGGEIVIGNFHTRCNSRLFLDYILDWKLIYRTEDDMYRLFSESDFGDSPVTIDYEEEQTNMLVRCTKPQ